MIDPGTRLLPASLPVATRPAGGEARAFRAPGPPGTAPSTTPPADTVDLADPHWDLAGRVLETRGIPLGEHVLLRENVATYLSQMMPGRDARTLAEATHHGTPDELTRGLASSRWSSERWTAKLERDLHAPYDDTEVMAHLATLDRELTESGERILAAATAPFPMRLYVAGSLAKGRFGARSDADVMVGVTNEQARAAACQEFLAQREDGISLTPLPRGNESFQDFVLMMAGPRIEVPQADTALLQGHVLQDAYAGVLERKGLRMSQVDGQVLVERVSSHPPRTPEVPHPVARALVNRVWTEKLDPAQKLEMMEHPKGLKGHAIRIAGTLVGAAASVPGPVGFVVRGLMDQVVRQSTP